MCFLLFCLLFDGVNASHQEKEDHHHTRHEKKQLIQVDLRQEGEQKCKNGVFFETTYGLNNFEHSYNPFLPGFPMGDPVLQIDTKVSTDCATLIPNGFNVQKTRSSSAGLQTTQTTSISEMNSLERNTISAGVGGTYDGIGASVHYSQSDSTTHRKMEKRSLRYFFTWIESFDTAISKMHTFNHTLDEHFLRKLNGIAGMATKRDRHGPLFSFAGKYSHFLHSAQLGSRDIEVRIVNETTLDEMKKTDHEFKVEESVSLIFVKISASQGGTDSLSQQEKDILGNSTSHRSLTGAKPDMDKCSFPKAFSPGVLSTDYRPICELIPNEARYTNTKEECFEIFESFAVCFAHFPSIELNFPNDLHPIKKIAVTTRLNNGRCQKLPPLFFNLQLDPINILGVLWDPKAKNLQKCVQRMVLEKAISFSFTGANCFLCFPDRHTVRRKLKEYKHSDCQFLERNRLYGDQSTFAYHRNDSCKVSKSPTTTLIGKGHCFSMSPCTFTSPCLTGFFEAANLDNIDNEPLSRKTNGTIFLPPGTWGFGEELDVKNMSCNYTCDKDVESVRRTWNDLIDLSTTGNTTGHVLKLNQNWKKRYLLAVPECQKECLKMKNCDMANVVYYPEIEGLKKAKYACANSNKFNFTCHFFSQKTFFFFEHKKHPLLNNRFGLPFSQAMMLMPDM
jgi:hypothetical protein